MKFKFIYLLALMIVISACKKNSTNRINNPASNYKPHMFITNGNGFLVADASNPDSVTLYEYSYNLRLMKFENSAYENELHPLGSSRLLNTAFYRNWPKEITDAVHVYPGDASVFLFDEYNGILDYNSSQDSAYYFDGNNIYRKFDFKNFDAATGIPIPRFSGVFGVNMYANKIDGFVEFSDYGIQIDTNLFSNIRKNYYYFDFDAGTFFCNQNNTRSDQQKETEYVRSEQISTLITKPYGNMTTNPIDFKLADAVFLTYDNDYNSFYFLDYDAMKYVKVTRNLEPSGDINLVNSDSARFNLITSSWQPISDLISGWRY